MIKNSACYKNDNNHCANKKKKNSSKKDKTLFFVEAGATARQRKPDYAARVTQCGSLKLVDSPTVRWQVYQDKNGDTIILATPIIIPVVPTPAIPVA